MHVEPVCIVQNPHLNVNKDTLQLPFFTALNDSPYTRLIFSRLRR